MLQISEMSGGAYQKVVHGGKGETPLVVGRGSCACRPAPRAAFSVRSTYATPPPDNQHNRLSTSQFIPISYIRFIITIIIIILEKNRLLLQRLKTSS